jgi:hypothetical protein
MSSTEEPAIAAQVRRLVAQLNTAKADDAWHSLVELGPRALPHLADVFGSTKDDNLRASIIKAVSLRQCYG